MTLHLYFPLVVPGMGISCIKGLDGGSTRGWGSIWEIRGLIWRFEQRVESEIVPGCRGPDKSVDENLMDAKSKDGQDIPEESAPLVAALDLVSGGEGGWRGAVPHFFDVSGLGLDPSGSTLIISISFNCSFHVCAPSIDVAFTLDPDFFLLGEGSPYRDVRLYDIVCSGREPIHSLGSMLDHNFFSEG